MVVELVVLEYAQHALVLGPCDMRDEQIRFVGQKLLVRIHICKRIKYNEKQIEK